jgi:steroid 5-alpha reductase family enzyme
MTQAVSLERRRGLHRRALWLEYFTVGWNVIEGVVAIGAGLLAGSVALVGFGVDSSIEVISALGLLWRLRKAGPRRHRGRGKRRHYVANTRWWPPFCLVVDWVVAAILVVLLAAGVDFH